MHHGQLDAREDLSIALVGTCADSKTGRSIDITAASPHKTNTFPTRRKSVGQVLEAQRT